MSPVTVWRSVAGALAMAILSAMLLEFRRMQDIRVHLEGRVSRLESRLASAEADVARRLARLESRVWLGAEPEE